MNVDRGQIAGADAVDAHEAGFALGGAKTILASPRFVRRTSARQSKPAERDERRESRPGSLSHLMTLTEIRSDPRSYDVAFRRHEHERSGAHHRHGVENRS